MNILPDSLMREPNRESPETGCHWCQLTSSREALHPGPIQLLVLLIGAGTLDRSDKLGESKEAAASKHVHSSSGSFHTRAISNYRRSSPRRSRLS